MQGGADGTDLIMSPQCRHLMVSLLLSRADADKELAPPRKYRHDKAVQMARPSSCRLDAGT